jgi:filamentous hemagglutinin family protein
MLAVGGVMLLPTIAQAQITPTITGDPGATGTIVTPTNTTFDITGGQTAGSNLFHSFSQFGLTQGQTANFQTDAAIQNVLARVNGGDPSVIDGLLRLSGANANLYLMNSAGIVFGRDSSVNLPASFIVTTSPHIGIQSPDRLLTNEFNAIGNNDYATLAGTPYRFRFPIGATGSIANLGDLTGLAFPLNETRTDFTGGGFVPIVNRNITPGLKPGGDNAIAFVGNTVFSPKPIFTTGANVVGVAAAENSTVVLRAFGFLCKGVERQ